MNTNYKRPLKQVNPLGFPNFSLQTSRPRLAVIGSISLVLLSAGFSAELAAQEAEDDAATSGGVETIVVNARRKTESIQEIPISIAAFSAETLKDKNVTDLQGLEGFVPNLTIATSASFGSSGATFSIRGAGQERNSVTLEPGVGLYIDGVYLGRSESGLIKFGDIEHIEVLRGPQGTLFGKNASGGAISIFTNRPNDEFSGELDATYGSFNRTDVAARINVPLTEELFAKLAVFSNQRDGYVERPDGLDLDDDDIQGARLQIRWQPTNNVTVDLSGDYSDLDRNGVGFVSIAIDDSALFPTLIEQIDPGVNPPFDDRWVPDDPARNTFGSGDSYHKLRSSGVSAEVNWDLGDIDFKSLSAYRTYDLAMAFDGDGTPVRMFHQNATREFRQFSEELQLTGVALDERLDWVVGAYYFTENPTEERNILQRGIGNFANLESFSYDQETTSYAVFGQTSMKLTDKVSATLGGRYSHDKKVLILSEPTRFPEEELTGKATFSSFTPRLDLQYQWNDDISTYISYSKGFKGGGINDRIIGVPDGGFTTLPFKDESNDTYETGFRSDLLDNNLRFNMTYFHIIYQDLQQALITSDPAIANRTLVLTENIGEAKVDGLEIDIIATPTDDLTLNASFGYLDSRISKLNEGTVGGFVIGGELSSSPKYSYTLGVNYFIPLESGNEIQLHTDYSWKDDFLFATDMDSAVNNPSHGLLSAQIAYKSESWSLTLFGTNLTDEYYYQNGLNLMSPYGFTQTEPGRPREFGLRLQMQF